jgi:hypothetical protein
MAQKKEQAQHAEHQAALAQASPELQTPVNAALAAGVPWGKIIGVLLRHAGDLPAIIAAVRKLVEEIQGGPDVQQPQ